MAGTLSLAKSHVSGVKLVLYCMEKHRMGARLSPMECQRSVATFSWHSIPSSAGGFGLSAKYYFN